MNYGTLQLQVVQNLNNRSDLTSVVVIPGQPAQNLVVNYSQDRIFFYQRRLFYPSDAQDTSITTTPGINQYAIPSGFQQITKMRLQQTPTLWIPLGKVDDYRELLNYDVIIPPFRNLPAIWAMFGAQFRLYPTPDKAYVLEITGNNRPPAPIVATDDNFWTEDAASLIIYSTCEEIARHYLKNSQAADDFGKDVAREYWALNEETRLLQGPLRIRAW